MPRLQDLPIILTTDEFQITRCELLATKCADCDRVVANRRVLTQFITKPAPYARTRCTACHGWYNTATGAYDLTVADFNNQMSRDIRKKDK